MKALILASGHGTRLHPITKITSKSLIDVKGKPIIAHILDNLDKSKYIKEIYIIFNNKFTNQFYHFLSHFKYNKKIEFITDKHKLEKEMPGSIGTINYFVKLKKINEDLLVIAGDNLFKFNIDDFIKFYNKHKRTSVAVYDFKNKNKVKNKFGVIELKKDKIVSFVEKPKNPKTSLAATLCYILSNFDLHHLDKKTFKENAGELIAHLVEHEEVRAFKFSGKWFDIGSHEDLERARKEF